MNSKRFMILGVSAAVLLALALWVSRPGYNEAPENSSFLADASGALATIDHIAVYSGSDQPQAELKKVDGQWQLVQRHGFPASSKKVGSLLIALAEAKIAETKTAKPENHAKLELEDPLQAGAKGKLVRFGSGDHQFAVIVGKQAHGANFVRREGENQTYLLDKPLTVPTEATDWLDTSIVDIPAADVSAVDETAEGSTPVHLLRSNDLWQLAEIPKGREAKAASLLGAAAGALSSLYFNDVQPTSELKGKATKHAVFHAKGGLQIEASGYSVDDDTWVVFTATVDPLAPAPAEETEKPEPAVDQGKLSAEEKAKAQTAEKKAAEEKAAAAKKAHDEATDKAAEINHRVKGWAFKLPSYKATELFKSMDDLLKPVEKKDKNKK